MCRIGHGISYCDGVSPRGRAYYDRIIGLFGDHFAPLALSTLAQYEIQAKLERQICRKQACIALEVLKKLLNEEIKVRERLNVVQSRSLMEMLQNSITGLYCSKAKGWY